MQRLTIHGEQQVTTSQPPVGLRLPATHELQDRVRVVEHEAQAVGTHTRRHHHFSARGDRIPCSARRTRRLGASRALGGGSGGGRTSRRWRARRWVTRGGCGYAHRLGTRGHRRGGGFICEGADGIGHFICEGADGIGHCRVPRTRTATNRAIDIATGRAIGIDGSAGRAAGGAAEGPRRRLGRALLRGFRRGVGRYCRRVRGAIAAVAAVCFQFTFRQIDRRRLGLRWALHRAPLRDRHSRFW